MQPTQSDKDLRQSEPQQPVDSAPQHTPSVDQPVEQQYFAQPQAAPVQYVVAADSLKGVKGWLLLFVVSFALIGLTFIPVFFAAFTNFSLLNLTLAPVIAILSTLSAVFISIQKRTGKWLAIGTLVALALYTVISRVIVFMESQVRDHAATLVSSIVVSLVIYGLLVLYFLFSKRVKETLVG
ncbi:hypothetical protein B7Y94_01945 [Candidatus Saccharibacteria bacterium 32-49-12]|nr:MAG: hypothetical protein B7Y94_01945 [Candidatus Saccharibacteria bacterium 32-49-12]